MQGESHICFYLQTHQKKTTVPFFWLSHDNGSVQRLLNKVFYKLREIVGNSSITYVSNHILHCAAFPRHPLVVLLDQIVGVVYGQSELGKSQESSQVGCVEGW